MAQGSFLLLAGTVLKGREAQAHLHGSLGHRGTLMLRKERQSQRALAWLALFAMLALQYGCSGTDDVLGRRADLCRTTIK